MTDEALGPAFKALADPTRRLLLDRLRHRNGQTLTELCGSLEMARQSATQHLDLLAAANLVNVVRHGRERLHYLNPAPIHEIGERWIAAYDAPRLATISAIKNRAEEYAMTDTRTSVPTFVYVPYIRASSEDVWQALTDADLTARHWGHANVSDWLPGSPWEHRRVDGSGAIDAVGTVLEAEPPTRLVITFEDSNDDRPNGPSVVTAGTSAWPATPPTGSRSRWPRTCSRWSHRPSTSGSGARTSPRRSSCSATPPPAIVWWPSSAGCRGTDGQESRSPRPVIHLS